MPIPVIQRASTPTNAEVIGNLEAAKAALEREITAATGQTADKVLLSIQCLADEVGALAAATLTDAYVAQTDAFKAVTSDAKRFVAALNSIKQVLAVVAGLAQILDKAISYIK